MQVEAADAGRALAAAQGGPVAEGAVGAGAGMVCFDWKGGIGTASRVVPEAEATVGVLVLANFGSAPDLRIDGVPVGRLLPGPGQARSREAGSCIAVVATDAPLARRAAAAARAPRRAGPGADRLGRPPRQRRDLPRLRDDGPAWAAARRATARSPTRDLNGLFAAAVDATEEAVLNALWAAPDVSGRAGHTASGLPHAPVLDLLRDHGRIA